MTLLQITLIVLAISACITAWICYSQFMLARKYDKELNEMDWDGK